MAVSRNQKGFGNKWRWWDFAQYFGLLSNLSLDYLMLSKEEKKLSKAIGAENAFPSVTYDRRELIVPILFNIYHSLELFLKGIARKKFKFSDRDLSGRYSHKLKELYYDILNCAYKREEKRLLKKLKKLAVYINRYNGFNSSRYPFDPEGRITLSAEELKKLSTLKNIKSTKKDISRIYQTCNDIGAFIYKKEKNMRRTKSTTKLKIIA